MTTDLEINSRLDRLDDLENDFNEMEDDDFDKLNEDLDISGKMKGVQINRNELVLSRAIKRDAT